MSDTVSGMIRKLDAKSFEVEALDTRFLQIQILDSTTKPADLRIGDGVDVTLTQDKDGKFQVTDIKFNREVANTIEANDRIPELARQQEEGRTAPPPTILVRPDPQHDPGDSGPPVLKRGKPARESDSSVRRCRQPTVCGTPAGLCGAAHAGRGPASVPGRTGARGGGEFPAGPAQLRLPGVRPHAT